MKLTLLTATLLLLISCNRTKNISITKTPGTAITGSTFYQQATTYNWKQRDSLAMQLLLGGNMPSFLKKFVPVKTSMKDSTGKVITATFYVTQDYISIGTDNDWARIPLTPMSAQMLADRMDCFLPTRKIVNAIYEAANIKLEPLPLTVARDSTPTMYQHHLMIEEQRKGRKGLIAGIKKDVVISGKISRDTKPNRVAIYGWHKLDGKPIQPVYTGHVNWYVDYSHGIRLISRKIKVDGKWMDYTDVLTHPVLKNLLCDEEYCDFYKYTY